MNKRKKTTVSMQKLSTVDCNVLNFLLLLTFQLAALKNASGSKKSVRPDGDSSSSVLYELLMKPETSKLEDQRRVADLERRLEAIEKAVGASADKMVRLRN